ncbi:uncharacterized protein LOC100836437 isoform X2 [Brachypodium distachyon]|uniref:Uncharacterized protein n=1 Tax=Brachypodium distachyon TaxID=15368 RepID=I1HEI3_BRADI|nr:uncharacterized protein LOC100836437 isoform X2 [Brachypodium distachyon]KQK03908.1 hypothetical protein BRADI_2g10600v3 [Brachypodium distachyon]|eukprot:XP_010230780.1 uncharacterized protein LOC100836437 isoform X2 [Brachypodium distachyon]
MSGGAGTGNSPRRVIKPQRRYMPSSAEQVEERSRLLSKMDAFYREACARLAVEASPATLARFLNAGVSVGLLDPVSNIMANTLVTSDIGPDLMDKDKVFDDTKLGEMAKRSLDGLVAFLVYFFPYLAGWDALRYLLVADADLLVAARLIVADRGMMGFSITSLASVPAFQAALRLAAQVSKHPQPQRFANVWMSLSSQLQQVMAIQNQPHGMNLVTIQRLLGGESIPDLGKAWDLATSRPPYNNIADMPYQATRALRMALLDTIRGFYLRALASLPRAELRSRYHRSMLKAGYCYGPLDPVSNIIVNTIWYDVMFAAPQPPVLEMIGPRSLTRLESRSFYGLASFLQTRYHNLSEHEVVQSLVANCAYLSLADPNFDAATQGVDHLPFADLNIAIGAAAKMEGERQRQQCRTSTPGLYDAVRKVEQQRPCASAKEAYEAASTAALHPDPEAHAVFLSSTKEMLKGPALLLLQTGDQLTSENVQFLASLFSSRQKPTPEQIEKKNPYPVLAGKRRSEAQQRRIKTKVKAALGKHLLQDGEPMYELHIICGANENVGSPEYCDDQDVDVYDDDACRAPCKFCYSHVNFLVTRKDSPAGSYPLLFFAEFDDDEEGKSLCCRVDVPTPFAEHVRCLYCESEGTKLVHPASGKFHGREELFEEAICEDRNDWLICENEYAVQHMYAVDEDFMYIDMRCIS